MTSPSHHLKTGKENFEEKKIHEKNIQCCNIIGHQKKIIVLYLGIKYNQKLSCTTSKCMYKYIMTEKMKEKNCLKKKYCKPKKYTKMEY